MNILASHRPNSLFSSFKQAPIELQLFLGFCILTTFSGLMIGFVLPNRVNEAILPITGWVGLLVPYAFNLGLTIPYTLHRKPLVRYGHILILAIAAINGIRDVLTYHGGYDSNPYLLHSPLRWVWVIAVPVIWILILLTPRVRKYYQQQ